MQYVDFLANNAIYRRVTFIFQGKNMLNKSIFKLSLAAVIIISAATAAKASDQLRVVGSSTVYPFTTAAAEQFGKKTKMKTPIIESTGTGGGFKLFCEGAGENTPSISDASRRIKPDELLTCRKNSVNEISEFKIGYDGIAVANSVRAPKFALSLKDLFLALGRKVPAKNDPNKLVDNFYKTWDEIDSSLPKQKISVYGPPPTSGTRDSFAELALQSVCTNYEGFKALYPNAEERKKACGLIREDGVYIEGGEDDNILVQKLNTNQTALGVFGYSFLKENEKLVQGSTISGVAPTHSSIADGSYILSRPLYVYVKRAHIGKVAGIKEFINELTSDEAIGEYGYLVDKGLIQMPVAELKQVQADVKAGKLLDNLAEEAPVAKVAPAAAPSPAAAHVATPAAAPAAKK